MTTITDGRLEVLSGNRITTSVAPSLFPFPSLASGASCDTALRWLLPVQMDLRMQ